MKGNSPLVASTPPTILAKVGAGFIVFSWLMGTGEVLIEGRSMVPGLLKSRRLAASAIPGVMARVTARISFFIKFYLLIAGVHYLMPSFAKFLINVNRKK